MKLFTMVYLYSEHYESFYHESEEAHFVLRTEHSVSAHPYCHPKVNAFCHAGTRSVKKLILCCVQNIVDDHFRNTFFVFSHK